MQNPTDFIVRLRGKSQEGRITVEDVTGLSRATIYRLIREKEFPPPLALSANAIGWRYSTLKNWLSSREAAA